MPQTFVHAPAGTTPSRGGTTAAGALGALFLALLGDTVVAPPGVVRWEGSLPSRLDLGFTLLDPRLLALVLVAPLLARLAEGAGTRGGVFAGMALGVVGLVATTGSLPHLGMALGLVVTVLVASGSIRMAWALGGVATLLGAWATLQVVRVATVRPLLAPLEGALTLGPGKPGLAPLAGLLFLALPFTAAGVALRWARSLAPSHLRTVLVGMTGVVGLDALHRTLRLLHAAATGRAWERFHRMDVGDLLAYALALGWVVWVRRVDAAAIQPAEAAPRAIGSAPHAS
jgi:hypothetical protein